MESTKTVALSSINKESTQIAVQFTAPKDQMTKPKRSQAVIRYEESKVKIERVKESLGVKTLHEVGQGTFDYYYENEIS